MPARRNRMPATGGNDESWFQIERWSISIAAVLSRSIVLPCRSRGTIEWRLGVARLNATAHSDSLLHSYSSLSNDLQPLVKTIVNRAASSLAQCSLRTSTVVRRLNALHVLGICIGWSICRIPNSDASAGDIPSDRSTSLNTPLHEFSLSPRQAWWVKVHYLRCSRVCLDLRK